MRTEWAYFIGGPFDLTKRPKPAQPDDRYVRLAMAPPLPAMPLRDDPDEMVRPVVIETTTYRLMSKVPQDNGDVAWIYVCMPKPHATS